MPTCVVRGAVSRHPRGYERTEGERDEHREGCERASEMVRTRVASVASVVGDGGGVIGAPREEEVERRVEDRPSPGRDVAVGTAPLGAPDGRRFGVRYLSRDGTTRRAGAAGNARVRGAGCRGCRHSCAATGSTLATADIAAARYPSRVARENGYGGKEERWRDLPSEPPSGD